jgi:hypothetical protein
VRTEPALFGCHARRRQVDLQSSLVEWWHYAASASFDMLNAAGVKFERVGISGAPGQVDGKTYRQHLLDHNLLDKRITMFKIDVEGAEWDVFQNMASNGCDLLNNIDMILVEFHYAGAGESVSANQYRKQWTRCSTAASASIIARAIHTTCAVPNWRWFPTNIFVVATSKQEMSMRFVSLNYLTPCKASYQRGMKCQLCLINILILMKNKIGRGKRAALFVRSQSQN